MPPNVEELGRQVAELKAETKSNGEKLDRIYTALFGVEGAGGLHRWVRDINHKLDSLEKDVTLARGKMLGIAIGISGFISILGFLATKLVK